MTMPLHLSFAYAFLLIALTAVAGLECQFSEPLDLTDDLTLEQARSVEEGTFTMRLTYTGGRSWIGIGASQDGSGSMAPATAVIGHMLDSDDVVGRVEKYGMITNDKKGTGVLPMRDSLQNLMNASFKQTDDTSILEFTQYLVDTDQVIDDDTRWIFAVGLPDNVWAGKHKIQGSFALPLTDCRPTSTFEAEQAPTAISDAEQVLSTEPVRSAGPAEKAAPVSATASLELAMEDTDTVSSTAEKKQPKLSTNNMTDTPVFWGVALGILAALGLMACAARRWKQNSVDNKDMPPIMEPKEKLDAEQGMIDEDTAFVFTAEDSENIWFRTDGKPMEFKMPPTMTADYYENRAVPKTSTAPQVKASVTAEESGTDETDSSTASPIPTAAQAGASSTDSSSLSTFLGASASLFHGTSK